MKRNLDRLMAERDIDVAVVTGNTCDNPSMYYMVDGAPVMGAILVKRQGLEPVLIHSPMDRDGAAASGLLTMPMTQLGYSNLLQRSETALEARVELYRRVFAELDVSGRVAFYGMGDHDSSYALLRVLDEKCTEVTITGEYSSNILEVARATKDRHEIVRMQRVAAATSTVMHETIEFIRGHHVSKRHNGCDDVETLIKSDGEPLTVGDTKRFVHSRLSVHDLVDVVGMIFSVGRDAGVPHSRGRAEDHLCLGQCIVFDLFPREARGGYFHDMTRTLCLGYASREVQKVYDDVLECQERILEALESETPTRRYEELACDIFEAQGHNTLRIDPSKQEGYIHALGHGVGLSLSEWPRFGLGRANQDILRSGSVFTVEPGVYYPKRGYGVRIEDTVWVDEDGRFHSLTEFPKELVIQL